MGIGARGGGRAIYPWLCCECGCSCQQAAGCCSSMLPFAIVSGHMLAALYDSGSVSPPAPSTCRSAPWVAWARRQCHQSSSSGHWLSWSQGYHWYMLLHAPPLMPLLPTTYTPACPPRDLQAPPTRQPYTPLVLTLPYPQQATPRHLSRCRLPRPPRRLLSPHLPSPNQLLEAELAGACLSGAHFGPTSLDQQAVCAACCKPASAPAWEYKPITAATAGIATTTTTDDDDGHHHDHADMVEEEDATHGV